MCASLYMCQHPTSVSMYPCPLCQPFGILGCFFPGAGSWSIPLEAFPLLFPLFIFFFPPVFQSPPRSSRCSPCLELCCHLASRSRQAGRSTLLPGKSGFLLPLGAGRPSENTHQQRSPQKKKIVKEGKHCDILGISQRDAAASLGRGFVGCKVFFIINYH